MSKNKVVSLHAAGKSNDKGDQISALEADLSWFKEVFKARLLTWISGDSTKFTHPDKILAPDLDRSTGYYATFIKEHKLSRDERLVLLLALSAHLSPGLVQDLVAQNIQQAGDFPQIGGIRGTNFRGFIPTGETAVFLLGGLQLRDRIRILDIFSQQHKFFIRQILTVDPPPPGEPVLSGRLTISNEWIEYITTGHVSRPKLSQDFPAQYLDTAMEWEDLILNESTLSHIHELEHWIKHHRTLMDDWGMAKKIKPGYRALFHGPPGTGKTLTATLLGKYTGREVYRVDLSLMISKFIGETEKNLSTLFDRAANKDWILFFDEADALFGKRTGVRDAHDKYANQEVSYLLQRVESHDGLVILASNFRSNIDDAFIRRFQSVIHFPPPTPQERAILWQKTFPDAVSLSADIQFAVIARKYDLTASNIVNIVQYCCLKALSRKSANISLNDLLEGIQKEYQKESKVWNG